MPILRAEITALQGKKVRVATRAFHHLVGWLEAVDKEQLRLRVQGSEAKISLDAIVSVTEAWPEESEFIK